MHLASGGVLEIAVRWSFESQMIAQRRTRIVPTKQATALQFWHDTVHEILEPAGHGVELHHEAVAGSGTKPVLHDVGNVLRRALDGLTTALIAQVQLAQSRLLLANDLNDPIEERLVQVGRLWKLAFLDRIVERQSG